MIPQVIVSKRNGPVDIKRCLTSRWGNTVISSSCISFYKCEIPGEGHSRKLVSKPLLVQCGYSFFRCFLHLLEGELGLVGLFGDGGGQGLFNGGTAEEENNFFEHGENSLIFVSVYSILHASGQFVSSLVTEMKKY